MIRHDGANGNAKRHIPPDFDHDYPGDHIHPLPWETQRHSDPGTQGHSDTPSKAMCVTVSLCHGDGDQAKPEDVYLASVLAAVKAKPLPEIAANYHIPEMRLLVGICCELQRAAGDRPFILSCRGAGRALGIKFQRANKFTRRLMLDGVLVRTHKGSQASGTASEFTYHGERKAKP
jgi:hypothetical protein